MEKCELKEGQEKKPDGSTRKRSPFDLLLHQIQRKKPVAEKCEPSAVSKFFRGRDSLKSKTKENTEHKENEISICPADLPKKTDEDALATAEHQPPILELSGLEKIKQFMAKFEKKPNNTCMNLNNCGLTAIDIMELVTLLPFLPELEELDVSWNDFVGGALKPVSIQLHHISKLKVLKMNNCRLTAEDTEALGESIEYIPLLEELDLSWNGKVGGHLHHLTNKFQRNCKMRVLKLTDCTLTSEDANALAKAMSVMHSLEVLDLSMNTSIGCSLKNIAEKLRHVPCLRALKLQMCGLNRESMQILSAAFQYLPELRKLDLSCNKAIGGEFQNSAADLSTLKQLQVLDIHKCGITEEDTTALTQVIPLLSNLEALNISSNRNIGGSAEHLFSRLRFLPKLKSVQVSHCALTEETFAALADALCNLSELKQLDLSWNKCVGGHIPQLSETLKLATALQELKLGSCNLVAKDVAVLASHAQARHLGKLRKLDLTYNNKITDDGWTIFFQNLDVLQELTELDFSLPLSTSRECGVWLGSLLANVKKMPNLTELGMQRWVLTSMQQNHIESFKKETKRNIELS